MRIKWKMDKFFLEGRGGVGRGAARWIKGGTLSERGK